MTAPQEEGSALAVSEDNTDDTSPENGQVIYSLETVNMCVVLWLGRSLRSYDYNVEMAFSLRLKPVTGVCHF